MLTGVKNKTMAKISKRALKMPASPLRKLAERARQRQQEGIKIYYLNIGQPDLVTAPIFTDTIREQQMSTIAYAPSHGLPEVLTAWQKYFESVNISLATTEMVVTTGGSEAIIFAMCAVADPGDEILVFEPFYTNYNGFAAIADVTLKPVTLDIKNGFHLPNDDIIKQAISDRTKAILICNPSNPTGTIFSQSELQRLVNIAKEKDLFILSDEVYREFAYDAQAISIMNFPEIKEQAILLDSTSKRFNVCGARVGVIASHNQEIIQTALKFAMARLSVASLEQIAVAPMLEKAQKYTEPLVKEFAKRREVVFEALQDIPGVTFSKPEGAFYIIIGLPVKSAEDFSRWLIEEFVDNNETVLLAPAAGFYATPGKGVNEIRLAFMLKEKDLKRALAIFKKALAVYQDK